MSLFWNEICTANEHKLGRRNCKQCGLNVTFHVSILRSCTDVGATFLKQNCESFIRPLPEYFPIGEDSNKKFGWELCPK